MSNRTKCLQFFGHFVHVKISHACNFQNYYQLYSGVTCAAITCTSIDLGAVEFWLGPNFFRAKKYGLQLSGGFFISFCISVVTVYAITRCLKLLARCLSFSCIISKFETTFLKLFHLLVDTLETLWRNSDNCRCVWKKSRFSTTEYKIKRQDKQNLPCNDIIAHAGITTDNTLDKFFCKKKYNANLK